MYLHNKYSVQDATGALRRDLRDLVEAAGVSPNGRIESTAQALFERYVHKGVDRWNEPALGLVTTAQITLLRKVGMYDAIEPEDGFDEVDELLLLGGIMSGSISKMNLARRLAATRLIHSISYLGSDRALESIELATLAEMGQSDCSTESDMLRALAEIKAWSGVSQGTRHYHISARATTGHRAHTGDTLEEYLRVRNPPQGGRLIVVSLNPHVGFQAAQVSRYLQLHRPDLQITMAAPSAEFGPHDIGFFMGAVARWFLRWVEAAQALSQPSSNS